MKQSNRSDTPSAFLLSRDKFRQQVLARTGGLCCICSQPAVDAHHIFERRLWCSVNGADGGYYLANGAAVCSACHLKAESTVITVGDLREAMGWDALVLPDHLYSDQEYDKWGNPVIGYCLRMKGELADDPSVKKVLALHHPAIEWTNRIKYPRTWHCPWSSMPSGDDRVLANMSSFIGKQVVVTEKMDGENTTMYSCMNSSSAGGAIIHSRSLDYKPHESRNLVKAMHAQICGDIPEGFRICGENLYARHSIEYTNLESYFQVFSVWDGLTCLDWATTKEWAELLGLVHVPVLYEGLYDESTIKNLNIGSNEGYVIRLADPFHYKNFARSVAKYVRACFAHSAGSHWKSFNIKPNQLRVPGRHLPRRGK